METKKSACAETPVVKKSAVGTWADLADLTDRPVDLNAVKDAKARKALEDRAKREVGLGHLDHSQHTNDPT